MATEEDNFDIDIYGDNDEDYQQDEPNGAGVNSEQSTEVAPNPSESANNVPNNFDGATETPPKGQTSQPDIKSENENGHTSDVAQKITSTDESTHDPLHLPKQAPQTQGLKRKDGADDRFVDPGATTALFISELQWWITDDDIRGWANQSQCEDELDDMTFSEHKVNGKSKGQAYVLFKSPQAATAAKHKIESFGEGQQYTKKFTVSYTNPFTNPFRTLPKDGPMRNNNQSIRPPSNNYGTSGSIGGAPQQQIGYNSNGGYRGNRGGYNNRGGNMPNMGGYNRGGFQQNMSGGFQATPMGGFQGSSMTGMQPYGGFQNRGGMMGGMRGGQMGMRGGRGNMMGMPMGGMNMGAMPGQMAGMGMGMPQMGTGMGMQGMQSRFNYPPTSAITPVQYTAASAPVASTPYPWPYTNSPASMHMGGYPPSTSSFPSNLSYAAASASAINHPPLNRSLNQDTSQLGSAAFQAAQPHYNPAFFQQQQQQGVQGSGMGDSGWNTHSAKRPRQE